MCLFFEKTMKNYRNTPISHIPYPHFLEFFCCCNQHKAKLHFHPPPDPFFWRAKRKQPLNSRGETALFDSISEPVHVFALFDFPNPSIFFCFAVVTVSGFFLFSLRDIFSMWILSSHGYSLARRHGLSEKTLCVSTSPKDQRVWLSFTFWQLFFI